MHGHLATLLWACGKVKQIWQEDITEQDCSFNGGQEAEWDKMVQKQNISLKDWSQWLFPPNSPHLFTITQLQIYQQYDPFMRLALS